MEKYTKKIMRMLPSENGRSWLLPITAAAVLFTAIAGTEAYADGGFSAYADFDHYAGYVLGGVILLIFCTLLFWLFSLNRALKIRSYELNQTKRSLADIELAFRQTHDDLKATREAIPGIWFELDEAGRYLDVRGLSNEFLTAPKDNLLKCRMFDVMPQEITKAVMEALACAKTSGFDHGRKIQVQLKERERWFELMVTRKSREFHEFESYMVSLQDITEQIMTERRAIQLKKYYSAVLHIIESVARATSQEELYADICRIIVDKDLMRMAWVGVEDVASGCIVPIASYGEGTEYLDGLVISTDPDIAEGLGITGVAWRDRLVTINNDFYSNPSMLPWKERAEKYGWRGSAAFPIIRERQSTAVLTVYNAMPHVFDEEIVALLATMVNEISIAANHLESKHALHVSEEQLRLLLESVRSGICGLEPEGKLTFINPAALRMLGYKQEEMINQNFHELVHHSYMNGQPYDYKSCPVSATLTDSMPRNNNDDEVFWRKDGLCFPVEYTTHPIIKHEVLIGAVLVFQDITAKKLAEAELDAHRYHLEELVQVRTAELEHARARAEDAYRAKSAFLANVSHEIYTPMNAILGFTQLLRSDVKEPSQIDKINKISHSAKHLLGIINNIIDLSRVEAEDLVLNESSFNLVECLEQALSGVNDQAEKKHLNRIKDFDSKLNGLIVIGDQPRLIQILTNYLDNAVKYTEQGSITLRVRLLTESKHSVQLRFEVEDTGIGISSELQSRLFGPFERGKASTINKYSGTGLGLAISRRLAHLMGGEAGVSGSSDNGSVFWFTVILKRGDNETKPQDISVGHADLPSKRKAKIILIGDDALQRELESSEDFDQLVNVANDIDMALALIQAERYDLIVMDMKALEIVGLEAFRRVRSFEAGKNIPILVIAANLADDDRKRYEQAGVNGFVSKPVDPKAFFAELAHSIPDDLETGATTPKTEIQQTSISRTSQLLNDSDPILDIDLGLKLFRNDQSSYQRMLKRFAELHNNDAAMISAALETGNLGVAERNAHSLKGVAANLGALALQKHAHVLELKIRDGEPIEQLQGELALVKNRIEELIRIISTSGSNKENMAAANSPLPLLREQASQLLEQLSADDMRATVTWLGLKPALEEAVGKQAIATLSHHIDEFDFQKAIPELNTLLQSSRDL